MDLLLLCRAQSEAVVRGLIEGGRGWPLTEAGRWQADRLGRRLAGSYHVDLLYSSPLQEAWETASCLGRWLQLEPQPAPDVGELDCGLLAGLALAQLQQRDTPVLSPPAGDIFTPFPDGESYTAMHLRVVKAVNGLVERAGDRTVAIVTHPGPIQSYWLAFLRYAIEQRAELNLRCDPASLHHIRRTAAGHKEVVRLNDIGHLLVESQEVELAGE